MFSAHKPGVCSFRNTNSRAQRPSSEGKCQDFKAAEEGRPKPRVTAGRKAHNHHEQSLAPPWGMGHTKPRAAHAHRTQKGHIASGHCGSDWALYTHLGHICCAYKTHTYSEILAIFFFTFCCHKDVAPGHQKLAAPRVVLSSRPESTGEQLFWQRFSE